MANMDYLHTAEILRAVSPHLHGNMPMISLFASMMEMMGTLRTINSSGLSAQSLHNEPVDVETMLGSIRPVLHDEERGFVDQILNVFNMKRTMDTYQEMMQMMEAMQGMNDEQESPSDEYVKTQSEDIETEDTFSHTEHESILFGHPIHDESGPQEGWTQETETQKSNPDFSSSSSNPQMFDMLKALLPSDKVEMLENMNQIMKGS